MSSMSVKSQIIGLVLWLVVCFGIAAIGALASINAADFYAELTRPTWAPPGALFGPVWSTLFLLMSIAAWLVWRPHGFRGEPVALSLFLIHLPFNALWSWLFFGWHLGSLAFVDVLLLWSLIAVTLWLFWRVNRFAGLLLLPYLLWVSFAAALNFTIWQLNPQILG